MDKLEAKYQTQIDRLQEKLRKEELELEQDKSEHSARKQQETLSAGDLFSVSSWVNDAR